MTYHRPKEGIDYVVEWAITMGIVIGLLVLVSMCVNGCIRQSVEIKLDSPDSSKTELGPKLEINKEDK